MRLATITLAAGLSRSHLPIRLRIKTAKSSACLLRKKIGGRSGVCLGYFNIWLGDIRVIYCTHTHTHTFTVSCSCNTIWRSDTNIPWCSKLFAIGRRDNKTTGFGIFCLYCCFRYTFNSLTVNPNFQTCFYRNKPVHAQDTKNYL